VEYIKLFEEYNKKTRSKEITIGQAADLYLKNCSDWDLNGKMIYRGSWTSPNFFYGHAGSKEHEKRISANTNNIYTSILDISENWDNVPKRSESYIMSTKAYISETFGDDKTGPHIMIPYNGTKIGVCTESSDFWWVNLDMVNDDCNFELFAAEIRDILTSNINDENLTYIKDNGFTNLKKPITTETIIEYCNDIDDIPKDKLTKKFKHMNFDYVILPHWIENYPNMKFLDYLKMILDFNKNKFTLVDNQTDYGKYEESEVWSDGEFIGINEYMFDEFIRVVKSKK
jgi:hypothetical protein